VSPSGGDSSVNGRSAGGNWQAATELVKTTVGTPIRAVASSTWRMPATFTAWSSGWRWPVKS
jgi:hypothetical protein